MFRTILHKHLAPQVQMGEAVIRQAIPVNGLDQISPFILLHHFDFDKGPGEHDFNVPPHPHRGFSPVTYIFEGSIRHTDSLGNDEVIGRDEVQWISAGRGLIHSERAGEDLVKHGGRMQGIQLWINTPKAHKMDPPLYQPVRKRDIPVIEGGGTEFRLVSGKLKELTGPATSEVVTGMLRMQSGSEFEYELPADHNAALYVLEGDLLINGKENLPGSSFVAFKMEEGKILLKAEADAKVLLLGGRPINEPMVSHGPFVMNSQTEILEAMRDYRDNKMGFLY